MQQEEATKVIGILLEADNGCSVCSSLLVAKFFGAFPEWKQLAVELYANEYGYEPGNK